MKRTRGNGFGSEVVEDPVASLVSKVLEADKERIRERRNRRTRIKRAFAKRGKKASSLKGAIGLKGNGHVFKTKEIETEESKEAKATANSDPSKAPDFAFIPCRPLIPFSWREYMQWRREQREPLFPANLPNRSGIKSKESVLTVERFAQIVNDIQRGCFRHVAFRAAGLTISHHAAWQKHGKEVEDKLNAGDEEQSIHPYHLTFWHFWKACSEAEGKARRAAEQIVFLMDPRFWLRFGPGRDKGPDEPGWTERVEIAGQKGQPQITILTIEDLMLRALPVPIPSPMAALPDKEEE